MSRALLATLLLASSVSLAGELVIAGGGKTREEALAAQEKFTAAAPAELKLASGFPRVLESATVKGLKPGFHVVVLGVCADAKAAREVARALAKTNPGTYVRTVEGLDAKSCPKIPAPPVAPTAEAKLREQVTANPASPDARYQLAYLLYTEGRLDEAAAELDGVLEKHPEHPKSLELARTISVLMMD